MHSCSFGHRSTRRSDGLQYLVLRLPARPLLMLLGRRLILPYSLYLPSGAVGMFPLGFFFTIYVQNTLAFRQKFEDTTPIYRVPLSIFDVLRFWRKLQSWRRIFFCFSKVLRRGFDVWFFWILSHSRSVHLLKESVIEGPFKADCLQWGLKKLPENLSSRSRASWLDYYLKNFISPVPPIISEVSTLVSGLLL